MSNSKTQMDRMNIVLWRRLGRIALAVLMIAGCRKALPPSPSLGGLQWRQSQEDNVREAVFRWFIQQHGKQICFLSVNGKNGKEVPPIEDFMKRFHDYPFAKPLVTMHENGQGFQDPVTGKPALHFWIEGLHWRSDAVVTVDAGGAAAPMSGRFEMVELAYRYQRWTVIASTQTGTM